MHGESGESFIEHHEDTSNQGGGTNTLQHLTRDQQIKPMHLLESFQGGLTYDVLNNINIASVAAKFAYILSYSTYSEIMADLSYKCCHSPADYGF